MLENLVYLELVRRGYEVYIGKLEKTEIDFVATRQEEKIYIQISERIERKETEQREYGNLLSIPDNYPKYVLRTDEFAGGNYEGIKTMHVADFLLSKEYQNPCINGSFSKVDDAIVQDIRYNLTKIEKEPFIKS